MRQSYKRFLSEYIFPAHARLTNSRCWNISCSISKNLDSRPRMLSCRVSHSLALLFLTITLISGTAARILPINLAHSHTGLEVNSSNILSFRRTMAAAVLFIHETNPHAQLNRIEATSPRGPTLNSESLTDISLYFALPSPPSPFHIPPSTIRLASRPDATVWGEWQPLQYLPDQRPPSEQGLGDILTSDIEQVLMAMRNAGERGSFEALDIVREEGMTEVWWQWQMSSSRKGWVWVGDESGNVEEEPISSLE